MAMIFISYSSSESNKISADIYASLLKKEGYVTLTHDMSRLEVDDDIEQKILRAIEESDAFVILLDSHSFKSDKVKHELEKASSMQKPIIPLLLETHYLPQWIKQYQFINFSGQADLKLAQESLLEKLRWVCSDESKNIRQSIVLQLNQIRKEKTIDREIVGIVSDNKTLP